MDDGERRVFQQSEKNETIDVDEELLDDWCFSIERKMKKC
jgi:hypothetical protein